METVKIQGKDYVMVNERIKEFRTNEKYQGYALTSEIIKLDEKEVVIKATITNKEGVVVATGIANEEKASSFINKTSYVENCETSAWGRALGNLGIGIDGSMASAEEVANAILNQNKQNNMKQEGIGGDYVFRSGKYAGKKISEVPDDYLDWYLNIENPNKTVQAIQSNINLFLNGVEEKEVYTGDDLPF